MQLDAFIPPDTELPDIPEIARAAEELGFGALWMAETQHNPFLACTLIAEHTARIQFGTAIVVSFARSPAVMAHAARDLAALSKGRFVLGLGTQVRAHIERRFGMPWPESPVAKLREQIDAIRAFWDAWQRGAPLNQRGDYYKLTLTSPFFTPAPIEEPDIPTFIAGVNTGLARLAGEVAQGFFVHPFHSVEYLKEIILPAVQQGAESAGRAMGEVQIVVNAFAAGNPDEREFARQQLSFYASTPSYRPVLARHGWGDVGQALSALAARKHWNEMPALISDEMLATFATLAPEVELPAALHERYAGLADRLTLYSPFAPGQRDAFWRRLTARFNAGV